MRPSSLLIYILLVHLLLCGVYGRHIGGHLHTFSMTKSHGVDQQQPNLTTVDDKFMKKDDDDDKNNKNDVHNISDKIEVLCKDHEDHCFPSKGLHSKLVTPTPVATTSTDAKPLQKKKEKRGSEGRKLSRVADHHEDVMAMTEMDYSPAKRKPPIHN